MVAVSVTLEETGRSILSSVYYKIIDDIAEVIKLPKDSLVILYKDTEVALTDARPNATTQSTINTPTTTTKRRIQATISESYNEDHLGTTAVHQQEFYPIFQDHDISVNVAPVYIQTEVEIEFSYITPSLSEANRIRDDIRLRLSQTRNIGHHEVDYNIIVPTVVEDFIADVHTLKNRLFPQDLGEYFLEHSTNRLHQITDMSNVENVRLAVREKQIRILGLFNFNSMPDKIDKDQGNSTYKLTFNYTFSLSIPKAMSIRYPVMICNQVLPSKYVSFIEQNKINSGREYKQNSNYIGNSLANLSHFEAHRQLENRVNINVPINIPLFDDFCLRQGHKGYGLLVSFLPQVDEADKKTLINLRDIDPYYIPDNLLTYIQETERHFMTSPYSSFMYLGLHQEDKHYDNSVLEITEDLTVKSKVPINLCKPVRVTIGMCIDISTLLPECLTRILTNPEILLIFLSEYISAVNTFKNEIEKHASSSDAFYSFLIRTLEYYIARDDKETVKGILDIVSKDNYTSSGLGNLLLTSYPSILEQCYRWGILALIPPYNFIVTDGSLKYNDAFSKDSYNKQASRKYTPTPGTKHIIERGQAKTVMTACVIAMR